MHFATETSTTLVVSIRPALQANWRTQLLAVNARATSLQPGLSEIHFSETTKLVLDTVVSTELVGEAAFSPEQKMTCFLMTRDREGRDIWCRSPPLHKSHLQKVLLDLCQVVILVLTEK